MSADPKRVEALFNRALAVPLADRAAFLAGECGDDAELRARVERLLAAHVELESLSNPATGDHIAPVANAAASPATATFGDAPKTEDHTPGADAGTVIAGKYKLVEEIGEGGMGSVWMAQQTEPVKRRVAVKLIKSGMDSRAVLARFEAERQALALMDHPNIAKVLDAGATTDGRPFFVMELVKGVPITKFCDDHKLTPRQRLELFVPVCQAIQHAHQKGVIHRDIKPSNVLVALYDDKPVPKVIDFGVAKATGQALTDRTLATGFGAVVGTPEYMSPEQASFNNLDIDTRSDVYALGVLLYELLAGAPPFSRKELEKVGLLEIFRVIREQEPPRPSTKLSTDDALPSLSANRGTEPKRLAALLRGELDWIVMKALEKDRARRYETANGFAADVQRYLAGEPVQAVPPSTGYRLRKYFHKHKAAIVTVATFVIALKAGTLFSMWQAGRAMVAEAAATTQRLQAETNLELAESKTREAEAARDRTATVLDAMTSEITGDSLATQKELTEEQKQFLAQALTYYKELADERAIDERTRARTARAAVRVAKIEYRFLRGDEAIAANRAAIERFVALVSNFPSVVEYREELAKAHRSQGHMLTDHQANHAEAHQHDLAAYAILQKLANDFPAMPRYRSDLVGINLNLYQGFYRLGMKTESQEHFRKALALLEGLAAEFAAKPGHEAELAENLQTLGGLLVGTARRVEGEDKLRKALAIRLQLVADNPEVTEHRRNLGHLQGRLGATLLELGRPEEAEGHLRKALAIRERLATDFPADPSYRSSVASSHTFLGGVLKDLGRHGAAEEHYRKGIAIREKLAADFPKRSHNRWLLGNYYYQFGNFVRDAGKPEDCLVWYDKAIRTLAPIVREKPRSMMSTHDSLMSHKNRARVLSRLGKHAEAVRDWDQVVELSEKEKQAGPRADRAYCKIRAGQVDEAVMEVAELTKTENWTASQWYNFACVYAVASAKIASKNQEYADRATELLRKAVAAGWNYATHMKADTDLDPIRDRDNFKQLLAELEKKFPPPVAPMPREVKR